MTSDVDLAELANFASPFWGMFDRANKKLEVEKREGSLYEMSGVLFSF